MVQTMTFSLQIALLEPDALTRAQLALALVRAKHEVIECADVSSLYEALDAHDKCAQAQPGFARVLYVRRAAYSAAMLDGLLPHLRSLYGVVVSVTRAHLPSSRCLPSTKNALAHCLCALAYQVSGV